jgi:hypothetical protein
VFVGLSVLLIALQIYVRIRGAKAPIEIPTVLEGAEKLDAPSSRPVRSNEALTLKSILKPVSAIGLQIICCAWPSGVRHWPQ